MRKLSCRAMTLTSVRSHWFPPGLQGAFIPKVSWMMPQMCQVLVPGTGKCFAIWKKDLWRHTYGFWIPWILWLSPKCHPMSLKETLGRCHKHTDWGHTVGMAMWRWDRDWGDGAKEPIPSSTVSRGKWDPSYWIVDVWPPQLWEKTLLLFQAPWFVVICYSSRRKVFSLQPGVGHLLLKKSTLSWNHSSHHCSQKGVSEEETQSQSHHWPKE